MVRKAQVFSIAISFICAFPAMTSPNVCAEKCLKRKQLNKINHLYLCFTCCDICENVFHEKVLDCASNHSLCAT